MCSFMRSMFFACSSWLLSVQRRELRLGEKCPLPMYGAHLWKHIIIVVWFKDLCYDGWTMNLYKTTSL